MFSFIDRIPVVLLLARGWEFARGYRKAMIVYFFLFALAQAAALTEPYLIGQVLNNVQGGIVHGAGGAHASPATASAAAHAGDGMAVWKNVLFFLSLYFLMEFFFWVFHGPGRVIERYVAFHIKANYRAHLFALVTHMPIKWHREHHSGESIDKINRATNSLATFFDNSFEISYMLFRLIGALIFLFCFMPFAGWVALGTTVAAFVVLACFDFYLYKQYDTLNKFENSVASAVHDYVTNVVSVITLRLEGRVLAAVKERIAVAIPLFTRNITIHEIKWFINTMMIATMTVLVLCHYSYGVLAAGAVILGGSFFTLFEYLRQIGESFYDFAALYGTVVRQAADVEGVDSITAAAQALPPVSECTLPGGWQTVDVKGVRFRYEDEKHRVHHLDDVSIRLEKGKSIALVGESGSGKSTLLSLLRGLQDAEAATVCVDGRRLDGGLRHLHNVTTLVPQDPEIFADTIRFNISFGLDVADSEVARCMRLARFEQVARRLPSGLETNVAEKGVNLSGGEKQRLALARGIQFGRESDIVLLDEPTSSVDSFNERLIYENLLREFSDKCVVSSVHKLHLLEMFDYIYVLADGRVVEEGDLRSLLANPSGVLSQLWSCCESGSDGPESISVVDAEAAAVTSGLSA